MVNELQARLHSLYNGRQPYGGVGPQTVGLERYRLVVTGQQLYTLLEAADRIAQLEAALRQIAELYSGKCEWQDAEGNRTPHCTRIARAALETEVDGWNCHDCGYLNESRYEHCGNCASGKRPETEGK